MSGNDDGFEAPVETTSVFRAEFIKEIDAPATTPEPADTGVERWTFEAAYAIESSPVVAGGAVYVGANDGQIYALDTRHGRVIWRARTGGAVRGALATGHGLLFAGSDDGALYALDLGTGQTVWSYQTGGPIVAGPSIADDRLVLASIDRYLTVFGLSDEPTSSEEGAPQ